MRLNPENKKNLLLYGTIASVVTLGLIWGLHQLATYEPSTSSRELFPSTVEVTPSPTASLPSRLDPYTHVLYPASLPPAGYEDWDCFSIPPGGNSFGAILVGGDSTLTRSDTPLAAVFVNGVKEPPIQIDTRTDPQTWNEVKLVQPGTVTCSQ